MKAAYRQWLEEQKYAANTIVAQMHRASRVEECHGDLDEHYTKDRMAGLIEALRYSTEDARRNRPNPSKIPFDGNNLTLRKYGVRFMFSDGQA
jgi:endonuclease